MTKTVKIIWTTAALLGAVSLFFNFREIPQETPPPLKNGEFLCPPDKQAEADRLKPPRHTAEEIGGYARLIENAPSPTEAWRLAEEARKRRKHTTAGSEPITTIWRKTAAAADMPPQSVFLLVFYDHKQNRAGKIKRNQVKQNHLHRMQINAVKTQQTMPVQ